MASQIFACCLRADSQLTWHSNSSPQMLSACLLMFAPSFYQGSCTAFFDSTNAWAIPHLHSVMTSFHPTSQHFVLNCLGASLHDPPCYTASCYSCTIAFLHCKSLKLSLKPSAETPPSPIPTVTLNSCSSAGTKSLVSLLTFTSTSNLFFHS